MHTAGLSRSNKREQCPRRGRSVIVSYSVEGMGSAEKARHNRDEEGEE